MSARKGEVGEAIAGGLVAGLIGGVVLSVLLLMSTLVQEANVWMALKGPGTPFLGERAGAPGFDVLAIFVGQAVHFAISAAWGILFGVIAYGWSRPMTVIAGLPYGIVVWLGMYYVALPIVGMAEMARATPVGMAVFLHLIFGLMVGVGFLPFQPSVRRAMRAPAT